MTFLGDGNPEEVVISNIKVIIVLWSTPRLSLRIKYTGTCIAFCLYYVHLKTSKGDMFSKSIKLMYSDL